MRVCTEVWTGQVNLAGRERLWRKELVLLIMVSQWYLVQTGYKSLERSLENQTVLGPSNGGMEGNWRFRFKIVNDSCLVWDCFGKICGAEENVQHWSEGGEIRSRDTSHEKLGDREESRWLKIPVAEWMCEQINKDKSSKNWFKMKDEKCGLW